MAKSKRSATKNGTKGKKSAKKSAATSKKPAKKRAGPRRSAPKRVYSDEDLKRMQKAPGDYEETARKFANALIATKFRGLVTGPRLHSMINQGDRLEKKASDLALEAKIADRARIAQQATTWKATTATWRRVVAAMPEQPELRDAFAFMQDYMSITRSEPTTNEATEG